MDRGFVFKTINAYMDRFNPGDPRVLQEFKFAFLEIMCSHEHYVIFNLPIQISKLGPKSRSPDHLREFTLSEEFCRYHFLVALLLQEIKTSLNEVTHIRRIALATLRDLTAKHELDDRYQHKGQLGRVALLYIPWLSVVLENLTRLSGEKAEESASRMSGSASFLCGKSDSTARSRRFTLHLDKDSPAHLRNSAFFEAIAGQAVLNGANSVESDLSVASGDAGSLAETTVVREPEDGPRNGEVKTHHRAPSHVQRYDKLQPQEVRDVLLVFLFVVKYMAEEQLIAWWQQYAEGDVVSFFAVLEMCLNCFRYVGRRNVSVVKAPVADAVRAKPAKAHTLPARMNPPDFNHEGTGTLVIHAANRENLVVTGE